MLNVTNPRITNDRQTKVFHIKRLLHNELNQCSWFITWRIVKYHFKMQIV